MLDTHRAAEAFASLVIVDDLQWLDSQSLALLDYLVKAAEATRHPLVVIAAARPSPVAVSFSGAITERCRMLRRTTVELAGLPLEAGSRWPGRSTIGSTWMRPKSSGVGLRDPHFGSALARSHGSMDGSRLVGDRLRALSPDAAELLNALAVGARPFSRDHLAQPRGGPRAGSTRPHASSWSEGSRSKNTEPFDWPTI